LTTLVGFSGSLRQASYNAALLRAAGTLLPADATLAILSIRSIPLYNADDEAAHGIPTDVARMKHAIAAADGLLIATPEYNNGIPGVTKNAIDWLSRPPADIPRVFGGKPVALMGASPGNFGTILSQDAWLAVLRALRTQMWAGGRLLVPHAASVFDAGGNLASDAVRDSLRQFLAGFVEFVRTRAR
jgi:chromate reductase, NAD(P)H dehydrogenase (quinone)